MPTYTKYKKIEKPLALERYSIDVVNKNNDIIDSELHKLELKNESQDNLLATKEALNVEASRATTRENALDDNLSGEISRAQSAEIKIINSLESEVNRATTAEAAIRKNLSDHISNESNPHNVTKAQIELGNVDNTSDIDKPVSTAQQNALNTALSTHNTSDSSHSDMRLLISGLTTRLNALADSDDTTLDQLSEIVAYIKNNKSLIDGITTSKVNVSDIIDDLTINASNKPLSARQGNLLKSLIADLTTVVENKVDKISGKGLSANDYTNAEKNKLAGIAAGAEVNVQADWNVSDAASDAFIKNKPTIPDINGITDEINALKNSVSDGKTLVANAITAKGVSTAADATFATMADNIANINNLVDNTNPQLVIKTQSILSSVTNSKYSFTINPNLKITEYCHLYIIYYGILSSNIFYLEVNGYKITNKKYYFNSDGYMNGIGVNYGYFPLESDYDIIGNALSTLKIQMAVKNTTLSTAPQYFPFFCTIFYK